MQMFDQKKNQVEITANAFYMLIHYGAVTTKSPNMNMGEFTLFLVDSLTELANIAVAKWAGGEVHLVHIKVEVERKEDEQCQKQNQKAKK